MIASFSRPRKKPSGTVTQMLIDDLREVSNKIKKKVDAEVSPDLGGIMTFEDYLKRKAEKTWTIKD